MFGARIDPEGTRLVVLLVLCRCQVPPTHQFQRGHASTHSQLGLLQQIRALVRLGEPELALRMLLQSASCELRQTQAQLRPSAGEAMDGAAYTAFLCQATFLTICTMTEECCSLFGVCLVMQCLDFGDHDVECLML